MRQFVYISTTSEGTSSQDVDAILKSSQRNNAKWEITGFLLWNGRNFLQLVEGPEAQLKELMLRLAADKRHSGIVKLEDIAIEERSCDTWAMAHIRLLDQVEMRKAGLDESLPTGLTPRVRQTVLNFASLN